MSPSHPLFDPVVIREYGRGLTERAGVRRAQLHASYAGTYGIPLDRDLSGWRGSTPARLIRLILKCVATAAIAAVGAGFEFSGMFFSAEVPMLQTLIATLTGTVSIVGSVARFVEGEKTRNTLQRMSEYTSQLRRESGQRLDEIAARIQGTGQELEMVISPHDLEGVLSDLGRQKGSLEHIQATNIRDNSLDDPGPSSQSMPLRALQTFSGRGAWAMGLLTWVGLKAAEFALPTLPYLLQTPAWFMAIAAGVISRSVSNTASVVAAERLEHEAPSEVRRKSRLAENSELEVDLGAVRSTLERCKQFSRRWITEDLAAGRDAEQGFEETITLQPDPGYSTTSTHPGPDFSSTSAATTQFAPELDNTPPPPTNGQSSAGFGKVSEKGHPGPGFFPPGIGY